MLLLLLETIHLLERIMSLDRTFGVISVKLLYDTHNSEEKLHEITVVFNQHNGHFKASFEVVKKQFARFLPCNFHFDLEEVSL